VISDMIVGTTEITEQDFAAIVEAGHPPGYTDFRDFIQGDYTYRRALFRAVLNSRNSDRGFIDALRVTVDVPDIFDRGTTTDHRCSRWCRNLFFAQLSGRTRGDHDPQGRHSCGHPTSARAQSQRQASQPSSKTVPAPA